MSARFSSDKLEEIRCSPPQKTNLFSPPPPERCPGPAGTPKTCVAFRLRRASRASPIANSISTAWHAMWRPSIAPASISWWTATQDSTMTSPDGPGCCLLYTSDAADDLLCVDLGGRRIIKKKKKNDK